VNSGTIVLVVEDEEDTRDSLRELLELDGYAVATATDGADALRQLDAIGDDARCIVLLDLFMPVMNGVELIDRLRQAGRLDRLRVVITTSAPQAAPAGIPVLVKPIDPDRMLRTVGQLV
jgi:CheY-like chemotaxis protein